MLQETPEGKWVASFRRALALNGIGAGTAGAAAAENPKRPGVLPRAGEGGGGGEGRYRWGARHLKKKKKTPTI